MKKLLFVFCALVIVGSFTACTLGEIDFKMHIKKAELKEMENNSADLKGTYLNGAIFDFRADQTIRSIQLNTYKLEDKKWSRISGGGGHAFDDNKGTIGLNFDSLANGMRTAYQSENTNGSVTHTIPATDDYVNMTTATSYLNSNTEIIYEKEIPLVIQIYTTKNAISSCDVEYFNHPEAYQKLGYEHVYAVTIMFSQKTLNELDQLEK